MTLGCTTHMFRCRVPVLLVVVGTLTDDTSVAVVGTLTDDTSVAVVGTSVVHTVDTRSEEVASSRASKNAVDMVDQAGLLVV
jgi:hypothetical protein